ncbi:unnamed protein product [Musa acuminata subsp. burmannicoides]
MLSSCSNLLQSPVSIGFIMNPPRLPLSSKPCRIMCLREEGARSPRNTLEGSRRSADYHPSIWDHHLIQSIESSYSVIVMHMFSFCIAISAWLTPSLLA